MKILFILKNFYIYEFKGIPQLSAILKREGHDVRLVLSEREDVLNIIKEWKPDVVGYSITTGFHKYYLDLNSRLKQKASFYSIFGGPHATYFPEIINEEGVDAVCIGEGEEALVDLLNNFKTKKMRHIFNFWIKEDGRIYKNDVRPLVKDLDKLPFLDRDLLYSKDLFLKDNLQKTFISSRGCPNRCTFCHNVAYNSLYAEKGNVLRVRSVDNLLSEINLVKDMYPLGLVRFDDDFFGFDLDWLREFSEKYKNEVGLPFHCALGVGIVNEERVRLLKEAGCVSLQLGLETGDEYYRKNIINKIYSNKQYLDACALLRKHGILVILNNIIGLPGETIDDAFKTLDLNIRCKPAYSWCTVYQPYPKTRLADYAVEKGFFDGCYNDIDSSYYNKSVLRFYNEKDRRYIENLQKLFAFTVHFEFLYPITKGLIKLPSNLLFDLIYKLWYGYTHLYIFPQKMGVLLRLRIIGKFFSKDKA